jgi:hypothetical protein
MIWMYPNAMYPNMLISLEEKRVPCNRPEPLCVLNNSETIEISKYLSSSAVNSGIVVL